MTQCDICEEMGINDCRLCYLGNPCIECKDYDADEDKCTSNGACGERKVEYINKEVVRRIIDSERSKEQILTMLENVPYIKLTDTELNYYKQDLCALMDMEQGDHNDKIR